MKPKSIILLSGGLDSTVNAAIATRCTRPVCALTIDYGQRAAKMEIAASRNVCRVLKVRHKVVRLPFFSEFKKLVMLGNKKKARARDFTHLRNLWVPNRNALFINIAACYAEYHGAKLIITGFNLEEAREFPDNSSRFVDAINNALRHSTMNKVRVKSYTLDLTKREIYRVGLKYGAPLKHIYSCYMGGRKMCGKCASCTRLIEAVKHQ
jgi:7-cyano-7-deazaguanine synthase